MSYRFSFKKFVNSDLVKTPTDVAANSPLLKIIIVGIPLIPYFGAVAGFASISSLVNFTLPSNSGATSSTFLT